MGTLKNYLYRNSETKDINISNVFFDIDSTMIVKNIEYNTNTKLIEAKVNNDTLTIIPIKGQTGTATIILKGTADSKSATDTFTITVN